MARLVRFLQVDNSYKIFSSFYNDISINEFNEFKDNLLSLPIEVFPVIHSFRNLYFDYSVYHIFHFIKNTKYVLKNINKKQRYFYSTYNKKVLQENIKQMEKLKKNKFFHPKSELDINVLIDKERTLSLAKENYNILFAWSSLSAEFNTVGMMKDESLDIVFNDFISELNAIRTTSKDAIKSLAILLFKLYDGKCNLSDNEMFVENVLRVCFLKEIEVINKNKLKIEPTYKDTFKVTTKEYRKNSYIYSVFDGIKIYGINEKNKYFYFYKMKPKKVMKMYFSLIPQAASIMGQPTPISKGYYKQLRKMFENPHISTYTKQYPEFFEKENPSPLDLMATFFQQMKKTAPDNLFQKD